MLKNFEIPIYTKTVYIDLETTGLDPFHEDVILGVAVGYENSKKVFKSCYYPFIHPGEGNLTEKEQRKFWSWLTKLDKKVLWVGHNIRFDLHFIRLLYPDFAARGNIYDTMMAAQVANERRKLGLKLLAVSYWGVDVVKENSKILEKVANKGELKTLPANEVADYACSDVWLTWRLYKQVAKEIKQQGLEKYAERQMKIVNLVEQMERKGLPINIKLTEEYSVEAKQKQKYYEKRLKRYTSNPDFNPRSSKQIQIFSGFPSSAQGIVHEMIASGKLHPTQKKFYEALLNYRNWLKADKSYYTTFLEKVDVNSRVHPNLNPCGTETGRFSCSDPNFQAMPRPRSADEEIYKVRDVIEACYPNVLIFIDYKQAEMRVAAHFADEETMIDLLKRGEDPHSYVAKQVFGSDEKYMRQIAKTINFGVLYGLGIRGLASMPQIKAIKEFNFDERQAELFLAKYHRAFPGFRRLFYTAQKTAKQRGYIYLFTGRRRRYYEPFDTDEETRAAINNIIQGTVAEIVNTSMLRTDEYLKKQGITPGLVLQVHDELIFDVPADRVDYIVPDMVKLCEDWDFEVPMPVDVSVGFSWGKKMPYDEFIKEHWKKLKIKQKDGSWKIVRT